MVRSSKSGSESQWRKTPVANLVRNATSNVYYGRTRAGGKLIWKSLKTDRLSVAKLRLSDFLAEQRQKAASAGAVRQGKMTFADALENYRQSLHGDHSLKERSRVYREERIVALLKSWPQLAKTDVARITKMGCLEWAARFGEASAPSSFNNTAGTLRMILDIAVEAGARYDNPASHIKRKRIKARRLQLPTQEQFVDLVDAIRKSDGGWGERCANFVEFLAYSGCRKGEAARVCGRDCDFEIGEITVLRDPTTATKNWEIRRLPMIPDMKRLLEKVRAQRDAQEFLSSPVMAVKECQGAIDTACAKLGIARFTHHDLRHLFATRCIESGVDIPTVSRWLGHRDGGALAMKVYGHLRDQHSTQMARRVTFSVSGANATETATETLEPVA